MMLALNVFVCGGGVRGVVGALTSWQLVVLILLSWLLLACGGCRSCCCCLRWAALERFFECAPVNIMTAAETIKPAALGRLRRPRGPARRSAGPRGLCAGRSFGSDCCALCHESPRGRAAPLRHHVAAAPPIVAAAAASPPCAPAPGYI
jgi:hypothetical protein